MTAPVSSADPLLIAVEDDGDCPACGAAFQQRLPYPGAGTEELRFTHIALCSHCGMGVAQPWVAQAQLDAFYATGHYWHHVVRSSRAQSAHERNQCRHRVQACLPCLSHVEKLRVLDVGAGHGWTANALAEYIPDRIEGFDFIEPDSIRSREILQRPMSFPRRKLQHLADTQALYHLVFLNHVLEHVAEPLVLLAEISRLLASAGVLHVETPHSDYRYKHDVFPHTLFFTPQALSQLASRTCLSQIECVSFGAHPLSSAVRRSQLIARAGFRLSVALGWDDLARVCDDRLWRYEKSREDGIWLRWLLRKAV